MVNIFSVERSSQESRGFSHERFNYPYLSGLDSEHDYFAEVCWCDDITGFGICTHKYKNSDVRGSADGDVDLIEDFDSSKWEVIGNIFDNPELLESEE